MTEHLPPSVPHPRSSYEAELRCPDPRDPEPHRDPGHRHRHRHHPRARQLTLGSARFGLAAAVAWCLLGATRLLTLVLPFGAVRRLLGAPAAPGRTGLPAPPDASATDLARARAVGRVVRHAAARTPWTSDCYPQALTARILLRGARVPHTVVFGLRRDAAGELRAHAWVSVGPVTVTGGSTREWTPVGHFSWHP